MTNEDAIRLANVWSNIKPLYGYWNLLVTNIKKNIKNDYRRLCKF